MEASKKDHQADKGLLLLGCLIYLVIFILWLTDKAGNTVAIFGGISALLTILSSYDVNQKSIEE